jgi:hypothetical protein
MVKLTVHGGDFKKDDGWFYPGGHFLLLNKDGKAESIPLASIEAAEPATETLLRVFGGDESLRADFQRGTTTCNVNEQMFIACFDDGRLLLASTDQESIKQICAAGEPESC